MSARRRRSSLLLEGLALTLGVAALWLALPAVAVAWMAVIYHAAPPAPATFQLSPVVSLLGTLYCFLPCLGFVSASILIRVLVARRD